MRDYENSGRVILFTIVFVTWITLMFLLSGCATVEVQTPDGTKIKTTTLWKDVSNASAQTEDMILELGSSISEQEAGALTLVCIINPALPICQMDE
jgi:hypothetical protein